MMRRTIPIAILALTLVVLAEAATAAVSFEIAATPDLPRETLPEVFMHDWLVLGPFPFPESGRTEEASAGWAADPVDAGAIRTLGDAVGVGETTMAWQPLRHGRERPAIDLVAHFGPTEFASAYLGTYIVSSAAADRTLLVGSDDGVAIWLNGEKVHENVTRRACRADEDQVAVRLRHGRNLLIAQVIQGVEGWAFAARFDDNSGLGCVTSDGMAAAHPLPTADELLARRTPAFLARPYLQNMTTDAATLMWWTDVPTTAIVTVNDQDGSWSTRCDEARLLHEVRVNGLRPDAAYAYTVAVRNAADPEGAEIPEDGTLRTFPDSDRPVRFLVYGDTRSQPDRHAQVAAAMAAEPGIDAVIHSGDLVGNGRNLDEWAPQFFAPANDLFSRTPLFACPGNHEGNSPFYFQLFDKPDDHGTERWYPLDLGPVHIALLDSNWDYSEGSEQYEWLRADLEANRDRPWKIVVSHHPTYTSGPHGKLDEQGQPREAPIRVAQSVFPGLAAEFGVDLFVAGHDHLYERSVADGVTYIISGGGGAPTYGKVEGAEKQNPYSVAFASKLHYAVVTADAGRMEVVVKAPSGEVIDQFVFAADSR